MFHAANLQEVPGMENCEQATKLNSADPLRGDGMFVVLKLDKRLSRTVVDSCIRI